eukprot:4770348-Ditylum_brightwellii.AAC.1
MSSVEYGTTIKKFTNQGRRLANKKKETLLAVSKITAELPIMHWIEACDNYLDRNIGSRAITSAT